MTVALSGLLHLFGLDQKRCAVCLTPFQPRTDSPEAGLLCTECAGQLRPRTGGYCPQCGLMYADELGELHLCGHCLRQRTGLEDAPPWSQVLFYGAYDGLLRCLLLDYKFNNALSHQRLLQALVRRTLALRLPEGLSQWDLVLPVPLHVRRLRVRGFNQSLELAKAAARELSLPLHRKILRRTRDTRPQFSLQRGERARNIRGAFAADSALLQDARVLLVDDIMTSGATVNEAARCLRRAGARRVDVFVLARAEG